MRKAFARRPVLTRFGGSSPSPTATLTKEKIMSAEQEFENWNRQEKWDRRFLELAKHIAQYSKDPSTKVGAILVNDLQQVVGMGYNGFPRGVEDSPERLNDRPTKYKFVVHAEVNACVQAGHAARGATLYVWPSFNLPPICNECAKVAIQAGVAGIVGYRGPETEASSRWADTIKIAGEMWSEAGLFVRSYEE
jgi:dCMP deaminase